MTHLWLSVPCWSAVVRSTGSGMTFWFQIPVLIAVRSFSFVSPHKKMEIIVPFYKVGMTRYLILSAWLTLNARSVTPIPHGQYLILFRTQLQRFLWEAFPPTSHQVGSWTLFRLVPFSLYLLATYYSVFPIICSSASTKLKIPLKTCFSIICESQMPSTMPGTWQVCYVGWVNLVSY